MIDKTDRPQGHIPMERIISRLDAMLEEQDYAGAGRLLLYWKAEAEALRDKQGELAIENELVGYYRKQKEKEKGLASVRRALALVEELEQGNMASGATILINCATAYKAFGMTEDAMPLYKLAEQVYMQVLPPGDSLFGALYNNMAVALVDLNRFEEAEAAYHSGLAAMEQIPGAEAEVSILRTNLAQMKEKQTVWQAGKQIKGVQ